MEEKKIIFLDIDGVLNNSSMENYYDTKGNTLIDKASVELLLWLIKETNASVVISSSWRERTVEETIAEFKEIDGLKEITPYIIGVTPRLWKFVSIAKGTHLDFDIPKRGCEIQTYINEHKIKNYVIIDDDDDILLKQKDCFVQTKEKYGLRKKDVMLALEILNGIDHITGLIPEVKTSEEKKKAIKEVWYSMVEHLLKEIKEKNLTDVDAVYFSFDDVKSSVKAGKWTPFSDSSFNVEHWGIDGREIIYSGM